MTELPARRRFIELAQSDESTLDLAEAALLIAAEEYPSLDVAAYRAYLDERSAAIRTRFPAQASAPEQIALLNEEIFELAGFRGNTEDYYDPRNSFLNEVIDRRKGIPITLSVIYLEVGWRLGWPLAGVGMPGHFLVKYQTGEDLILVDPFAGGKVLSPADCQDRLDQLYGGRVRLRPDFFASVTKRQILVRVLNNLKAIYLQTNDLERALSAVDRILVLTPEDHTQVRDRGVIHFRRGDYSSASGDLQSYLQATPPPADSAGIQRALEEIWRQQARLN